VDVKDLDFMRIEYGIVTLVEISQNVTIPFATIGDM
jgi:hypothetical protein